MLVFVAMCAYHAGGFTTASWVGIPNLLANGLRTRDAITVRASFPIIAHFSCIYDSDEEIWQNG